MNVRYSPAMSVNPQDLYLPNTYTLTQSHEGLHIRYDDTLQSGREEWIGSTSTPRANDSNSAVYFSTRITYTSSRNISILIYIQRIRYNSNVRYDALCQYKNHKTITEAMEKEKNNIQLTFACVICNQKQRQKFTSPHLVNHSV